MENVLGTYINGNYRVVMFEDGTKIRYNNQSMLIPQFPESIDCKISDRCDMGCAFCHEQSTPNGALANLNHPIFDSLHSFSELSLGGGNALEHPGLEDFLRRMARQRVICNITVHLDHFMKNASLLYDWTNEKLIHGLGVSVNRAITAEEYEIMSKFKNLVVHLIAGVSTTPRVLTSVRNMKLLILGYKDFGRGHKYFENNGDKIKEGIDWLCNELPEIQQYYKLISFDNLALEQLKVRDWVDKKIWDTCYMGDDGKYTMYLDMVKEEFAMSSISPRYKINSNSIDELFRQV